MKASIRYIAIAIMFSFALLCALADLAHASDVRGVQSARALVRPQHRVEVELLLRGEELTEVAVVGDGDGDVDCYLLAPDGTVVSRDTDDTDTCLLRVTPSWTTGLVLRIDNNGHTASMVLIVVN